MLRTNFPNYVMRDRMSPQGPYDGYRDSRDYGDRRDYGDMDSRRGRDRADYRDYRDMEKMRTDYRDYNDGRDYRDYRDYNDGRNPYGSAGGYVRSSRRDRADMSDYRDMEDGNRQSDYRRGDRYDSRYDRADYNMDYERGRERDGHYFYPFEMRGMFGMDDPRSGEGYMQGQGYGYDYASKKKYLEDEDIKEWKRSLMEELDEKEKQMFNKDMIEKKAESYGIKFDKFTPEEFCLTVLMLYTDYSKTLGSGNIDIYIRLAKDWLMDDDIKKKYSEKLASYYHTIVKGK